MARLYGELFRRIARTEISTVASAERVVDDRHDVHRMPFARNQAHRPTNVLRWTRWADQYVARHGTGVIHVGNVRSAGYVAAWLRRQRAVPYVVYVHGKDLLKERRKGRVSALVRFGTREILGSAGAIVANSSATADLACDLLRTLGRAEAAERVHVVHPGVDPERFRPAVPGAMAWRRTVTDPGPLLLSVARLVPRKGIDTTIAALPNILTRYPDAMYVIVGTGPDRTRLEALASGTGVSDHVTFVGDVRDDALPMCYAAADVFVLPVRTIPSDEEIEGFGIVYIEAAAAAVPSVAGRTGGVADAVVDGVTGLLVPPSDPPAVAQAVLRLLDDPGFRTELGWNGRRAVERHFHWTRAAEAISEIVRELHDDRRHR